MQIRLSYGTAVKMGLKKGKMLAEPTTAYIMVGERCISNCSFCAQARSRRKEGYLSRVLWLPYPEEVLSRLEGFARICFQTLDYPEMVDDLLSLLSILPKNIPVSVSIVPITRGDMLRLKEAGVDIISFALDAANPEIFYRVKGGGVGNRFTWEATWGALDTAKKMFHEVNTHLIVGLGESDLDLYRVMKKLRDEGITVALFSYTPVNGGNYPDVGRYRAIQLTRYLLYKGYDDFLRFEDSRVAEINANEREKKEVLHGVPFLTSGCPGCNRPFYNERPGGTIYNYPQLPKNGVHLLEQLKRYTELRWFK